MQLIITGLQRGILSTVDRNNNYCRVVFNYFVGVLYVNWSVGSRHSSPRGGPRQSSARVGRKRLTFCQPCPTSSVALLAIALHAVGYKI